MDGEYGIGKDKTVQILNALSDLDNIQVVAIAGKNEKLKDAFDKIVIDKHKEKDIKVLPFTTLVPELMSISSLVITKPGGLTTSESLASHLPLIIINPIPGQEEENAEFLEQYGCGVWLKKIDEAKEIISAILLNDEKLEYMREKSIQLSRPNSSKDICKIIFGK